jgi:hypothetical protein
MLKVIHGLIPSGSAIITAEQDWGNGLVALPSAPEAALPTKWSDKALFAIFCLEKRGKSEHQENQDR